MADPRLTEYLRAYLSQGYKPEQLKQHCLSNNIPIHEIDAALLSLGHHHSGKHRHRNTIIIFALIGITTIIGVLLILWMNLPKEGSIAATEPDVPAQSETTGQGRATTDLQASAFYHIKTDSAEFIASRVIEYTGCKIVTSYTAIKGNGLEYVLQESSYQEGDADTCSKIRGTEEYLESYYDEGKIINRIQKDLPFEYVDDNSQNRARRMDEYLSAYGDMRSLEFIPTEDSETDGVIKAAISEQGWEGTMDFTIKRGRLSSVSGILHYSYGGIEAQVEENIQIGYEPPDIVLPE